MWVVYAPHLGNPCGVVYAPHLGNPCGVVYAPHLGNPCGVVYAPHLGNPCGVVYAPHLGHPCGAVYAPHLGNPCGVVYAPHLGNPCGVVYAPHLGNPSPLGSIMGEGAEVGIVPRFSQELFDRVEGSMHQQVRKKYVPVAVKGLLAWCRVWVQCIHMYISVSSTDVLMSLDGVMPAC